MRLLEGVTAQTWDELIQTLPDAHILQTWEWGQSKIRNGWKPYHVVWENTHGQLQAAALVLSRKTQLLPGLSIEVLYCPKGPLLDWDNQPLAEQVLADLESLARQRKAVFIKVDPDVVLGWGVPGSPQSSEPPEGLAIQKLLVQRGWNFSSDQIQFRNTVFIDLQRSEEEILASFKQKTRYNIRLAERKGVRVREADESELPLLYRMYAETAVRDGFVIRHETYYTDLWSEFMQAGMAKALIAEVEDQPVGGLVLFYFAGVSRYMFGMSTEKARERMPNYLLQWEAMRLSKTLGCHTYDMWGAPDVFVESDPLWGVYRFKEGFNGKLVRHLGAWDYTSRPGLYLLYTRTLPKILDVMRTRGKAATQRRLSND
jgi:lipid II:glycine glycyltransferase (peptidoglycan interpeptide bridge formation enzyme)